MDNKNNKLDYSIENYKDRLQYLIDNGFIKKIQDIDNVMHNKRDLDTFKNYKYEQSTTYLLRSKDLESYYDIEYSHYRDLYQFIRSMSGSKLKNKNDKLEEKEFIGKNNIDIYAHKKGFDEQVTKFEGKYQKDYNYIEDDYVNSLFQYNKMTSKEIKNLLNNYKKFIDDVENECLMNNVNFIVNEMKKSCSNDEDEIVLSLFMDGMSETEISKEMGKSRQSINQRINKIIKKSGLIYEKSIDKQ